MKKLYGGSVGATDSFGRTVARPQLWVTDGDIEKYARDCVFDAYPKNQGYSQHFWLYVEASTSQIDDVQYK